MIFRLPAFCLYALLLAAFISPAWCQEESTPDAAEENVAKALRAAFLGDADGVHQEARRRRQQEQWAEEGGRPIASLSENIEALAIAARRPLPTLQEKREALADFRSDQITSNLDRLIRREEPRQRFLEAHKDRRYEKFRALFNTFAGPASSLVQGQFFPLFALPFQGLEYLAVGRLYLTPEQRREYFLAREAAQFPPSDEVSRQARNTREEWDPRRRRLSALQAKINGQRAMEDGRLETAIFWFEKEQDLRRWSEPQNKQHLEVRQRLARERAHRRQSLTVVDGDALFFSPEEFSVYTDILRALMLENNDTLTSTTRQLAVNYPSSAAADDAQAARAALARRKGNNALARLYLEDLEDAREESLWASRAADYLKRPAYAPGEALEDARGEARDRFWAYLLKGENPEVIARSLTADEARLERRRWFDSARGLFITDTAARAMALPFVLPFPKPELIDTAARIDSDYFETSEGERWLRRVMKAQATGGQYFDAAETARRLGDTKKALAHEKRAARRLERLGDEAPPRLAIPIYTRILNAYTTYPHRARVEEKLEESRFEAGTVAVLSREELRAWPKLWRNGGLPLNEALLDGRKENGEISEEGVRLLAWDAFVYNDRAADRRVEVPIEPEQHRAVRRLLEPRRRSQAIRAEVKEPLPRRKIPIALEAGAVPGFQIAPALVPLQPDPAQRELYE